MAKITQQEKDQFNQALAILETVLRGGRTEVEQGIRRYASSALANAIKDFEATPTAETFLAAQSAMEVFELFS